MAEISPMLKLCSCRACRDRVSRGLSRFAGVSACPDMHILPEELAPPAPATMDEQKESALSFSRQQRELLIESVGDALGMLREEFEGRLAAYDTVLARLEARSSAAVLESTVRRMAARPPIRLATKPKPIPETPPRRTAHGRR